MSNPIDDRTPLFDDNATRPMDREELKAALSNDFTPDLTHGDGEDLDADE